MSPAACSARARHAALAAGDSSVWRSAVARQRVRHPPFSNASDARHAAHMRRIELGRATRTWPIGGCRHSASGASNTRPSSPVALSDARAARDGWRRAAPPHALPLTRVESSADIVCPPRSVRCGQSPRRWLPSHHAGHTQRRNRSVALTSWSTFPASIAEWPASPTTISSASGHARCSSQALSMGQTTS